MKRDPTPRVRSYARSLAEMARLLAEYPELVAPAKKPLRQVASPSSPWKGMSALGMALIFSPDPFTDVIGLPLFLVGQVLSKTKSPAKLSDVYLNYQRLANQVKELKEGLRL